MGEKYTFGWSSDPHIEIPELDAFLADLDALFEKHGAALDVEEDGYGEDRTFHLILTVPGSENLDIDLSSSDAGKIPWLKAARQRYDAALEEAREKSRLAEEKKHAKARELAVAKIVAEEARIISEGITLSDGRRFKLIPE